MPDLSHVYNESEDLDEKIRQFETYLENAPLELLKEQEKLRTTMPAPDDLESRHREKLFLEELKSKREVSNQIRSKRNNTFLLVLLTLAILAVLGWIYQAIQQYGIFN